jgi:ADP-ribosylglycohydrolase
MYMQKQGYGIFSTRKSRFDGIRLSENSMKLQDDSQFRRAMCSLEGLSVGDAFGERYFINPDVVDGLIESRALAEPPWLFTDDTLMALSIVSCLRLHEEIEQNLLAKSFAARYDPSRGYGPSMHGVLARIAQGEPWPDVTRSMFGGQGSFGNGAAMRVAPVGAYFADDLNAVVAQASLSAEVTHAHEEAIAGAIAVAVGAAIAWRWRESGSNPGRQDFLDQILPYVPKSEVSSKIRQARDMAENASLQFAVAVLGNGVNVSAQDTVPFSLWCAGKCLDNFEEALWLTVSGLGDRDTTCAIVGGIVAMYTGIEGIPEDWLSARELLPEWILSEQTSPEMNLTKG